MSYLPRLFSLTDVERLKARGDIGRLLKTLRREKEPHACLGALQALIELGHARDAVDILQETASPWAIDPLIALLSDTDKQVRQGVVAALAKIGPPAVGPLIVALGSEKNRWARQAIARALGQIGDARAEEPLMAALRYGKKDLRRAAAGALEQLDWPVEEGETETDADVQFVHRLRREALHYRERRAAFVLHKLAFIVVLFGIAAFQVGSSPGLSWLLFALPVVGLAYDVYICAEDFQVKQIAEFLRSHVGPASQWERDWDECARHRRGRLGVAASLVLTVVAALPCFLDASTGYLLKFGWVGFIAALAAGVYLVYRHWCQNRM